MFSSCIKEEKKKDAEEQNSQDAMDAEDEVEHEKVLTVRHLNIAGLQSFKESGCCKLHNLGGWNEWVEAVE
ncbi:hypothetical protein QL285_029142 [Trifolium repens]|nr:hypothetical protein QL285_029142 [Trifolium repens]